MEKIHGLFQQAIALSAVCTVLILVGIHYGIKKIKKIW